MFHWCDQETTALLMAIDHIPIVGIYARRALTCVRGWVIRLRSKIAARRVRTVPCFDKCCNHEENR